jgi:hypothetical protein
MSSTHLYRWLRWLLPLLVARALVPAGFMLSVDAGGLALTFCPSVAAPPAEHHAQAHHEHGSDATHDHEQHHRGHDTGSLCPFALVAGACSTDIPHVAVNVERPSFAPVPFESAALSGVPLRAERIRGPPVVS